MKIKKKIEVEIDVIGNRCSLGFNGKNACPFIRYIDTWRAKCEFYHVYPLEFDFKENYKDGHNPLRCKQCLNKFGKGD